MDIEMLDSPMQEWVTLPDVEKIRENQKEQKLLPPPLIDKDLVERVNNIPYTELQRTVMQPYKVKDSLDTWAREDRGPRSEILKRVCDDWEERMKVLHICRELMNEEDRKYLGCLWTPTHRWFLSVLVNQHPRFQNPIFALSDPPFITGAYPLLESPIWRGYYMVQDPDSGFYLGLSASKIQLYRWKEVYGVLWDRFRRSRHCLSVVAQFYLCDVETLPVL